jgi:hypothetical protein
MSECLTKSDIANKVLRRVGIFETTVFQSVGKFASSIFLTSIAENMKKMYLSGRSHRDDFYCSYVEDHRQIDVPHINNYGMLKVE